MVVEYAAQEEVLAHLPAPNEASFAADLPAQISPASRAVTVLHYDERRWASQLDEL